MIGKLVRLLSDTVVMVVVDYKGSGEELLCAWHDDRGVPHEEMYPVEALQEVNVWRNCGRIVYHNDKS